MDVFIPNSDIVTVTVKSMRESPHVCLSTSVIAYHERATPSNSRGMYGYILTHLMS